MFACDLTVTLSNWNSVLSHDKSRLLDLRACTSLPLDLFSCWQLKRIIHTIFQICNSQISFDLQKLNYETVSKTRVGRHPATQNMFTFANMHSPVVFMSINCRYEFIFPLLLLHPLKATTVAHTRYKPCNTKTNM